MARSKKRPFGIDLLTEIPSEETSTINGGKHHHHHHHGHPSPTPAPAPAPTPAPPPPGGYKTMMASFIDPATGKVRGDF